MLCFNMLQAPLDLPEETLSIYLYIYLAPYNAFKQRADPVMLQAMTWRHKLHVNQSRVCPEVVRYTISKTALQPFVNVICLIALYQYTDETCSLAEVHRERCGHIHFNTCILLWRLILFLLLGVHCWHCVVGEEAILEGWLKGHRFQPNYRLSSKDRVTFDRA